jgi:murein DD-endopeptidase MepM/ murein hydrolase activator NlpD
MAKARTISLSTQRMIGLLVLVAVVQVAMSVSVQYIIAHSRPGLSDNMVSWLANVQAEDQQKLEAYQRQSLDALAKRLGQMQAQMQRLDALGMRLAQSAGIKLSEFAFDKQPGEGGPYIPSAQQDVSLDSLSHQIDKLALSMDDRNDKLTVLETLLLQDRSNKWLIPSGMPVRNSWFSSNFGVRIDPFTGKSAMHEGVDFVVPTGTPVYASAGGVVDFADFHPQFGNLVEIDHGNGVVTRYAHNSKLLVKVGQIVKLGQEISLSGSTGRATGPHVHFEVRYQGTAQNPIRFLNQNHQVVQAAPG